MKDFHSMATFSVMPRLPTLRQRLIRARYEIAYLKAESAYSEFCRHMFVKISQNDQWRCIKCGGVTKEE